MVKIFKRKIYIAYLKFMRHRWEGYKYRRKTKLSDTDILPTNSSYYLGLVAIFRGENDYLIEWIEFHKMMGIKHFVLYDNGLEIGTQVILNPYIENGLVTLIPFPDIPGLRDGRHAHTLSIQQMAYADCIVRFKHHFTYLLQLDIDEFLFPKKCNSITDVLNEYDDSKLARIDINWTNFGDNGHLTKPNGLVIKNFTRAGGNVVPQTIKCISNTRYLSKILVYTNVHRFSHRFRLKEVLTKLIWGYPQIIKGKVANDLFQLNHYCTKSKEEFLAKEQKTKKGMQKGMKTKEIYIKLNNQFNHVEDKSIFRFIPKLEKILNQLNGVEPSNC